MAFSHLQPEDREPVEQIVDSLRVCNDCGSVVPYWKQADHLVRCPPPKTSKP